MNTDEVKITSLGLNENLEGALCYLLGFLTGIAFLLLEKDNKFVRFHAMQSTATFLVLFVVGFILMWIPFLGWVLGMLLGLLDIALWLVLMWKAYQGDKWKLPVVGDFAEKETGGE